MRKPPAKPGGPGAIGAEMTIQLEAHRRVRLGQAASLVQGEPIPQTLDAEDRADAIQKG